MEIFYEPAMAPFLTSLYVLAGLVAIELALLVLGADLFHFVDDLLPDLGDHDLGDMHAPEGPAIGKALAFVGVGKVPLVMVLMSFLALFGLAGYIGQHAAKALAGDYLPLAAAVPAALALSLAATGRVAAVLARVLPSEETSAVSAESLIGSRADVVWGDATFTRPATAKVSDRHGKTHHIQLKASAPEEIVHEGEAALIVSRSSGFFIGTRVPDQHS